MALTLALGAVLSAPGCARDAPEAAAPGAVAGADDARPAPALPAAVARTRDQLVAAARQGDWAALDAMAAWEPGPDESPFLYTLGPLAASPAAYWQATDGQTLREMVAVLSSQPTPSNGVFGWPSWAHLPPDSVPRADLDRYRSAVADPASASDGGDYAGPVTAIDSSGRWLYYVAGE